MDWGEKNRPSWTYAKGQFQRHSISFSSRNIALTAGLTSWKNALGFVSERAMKAFLFSWRRWEIHTTNCKLYCKGRPFLEARF